MGDVLIVQNAQTEGPGYLGELLQRDGFDIDIIHAKHEMLPDLGHLLVVILGAPESANQQLKHLQAEQQLIKRCVDQDTPVLGICLGAQLIAKAFGGAVYSGPKKEIGFYNDLVPNPRSNLFAEFENPFMVFHWHGDTFDLPECAVRLAHSKMYQNQAFQIRSAVGLQFHLEVDKCMICLWLDKTQERLQIPYNDLKEIRQEIDEKISDVKTNMRYFYNNFKSEFGL